MTLLPRDNVFQREHSISQGLQHHSWQVKTLRYKTVAWRGMNKNQHTPKAPVHQQPLIPARPLHYNQRDTNDDRAVRRNDTSCCNWLSISFDAHYHFRETNTETRWTALHNFCVEHCTTISISNQKPKQKWLCTLEQTLHSPTNTHKDIAAHSSTLFHPTPLSSPMQIPWLPQPPCLPSFLPPSVPQQVRPLPLLPLQRPRAHPTSASSSQVHRRQPHPRHASSQ